MPTTEIIAVAAIAISVIGALASAGGSVIGFVRGLKKIAQSWVKASVERLNERFEYHERTSDRQIFDLQAEQVNMKRDYNYIRDEVQDQRRELQEVRSRLSDHIDNEERHV